MKSKIFIINLERNKTRKKTIKKQLDAYGINDYEFIRAIDGNKLTNPLISLKSNQNRKNVNVKFAKHFSNNEIACLKSHALAIERAIDEELDYVIILEDDVILCEDWNERLKKLLRIVPKKWNHLFLSGFITGFDLVKNQNKFNPLNFAPFLHVEKTELTIGAFSYVLKREIFEVVRNGYLSLTEPTDNIIAELIDSGNLLSYTFFPFLTYHDNDIRSEIWDIEYLYDHESKRYFVKTLLY